MNTFFVNKVLLREDFNLFFTINYTIFAPLNG